MLLRLKRDIQFKFKSIKSFYFFVLLYSFLFDINSNLLICSYIVSYLNSWELFPIFLFFIIFCIILLFFFNFKTSFSFNYNFLVYYYFSFFMFKIYYYAIINYIMHFINVIIINYLRIFTTQLFIFNYIKKSLLYICWYPIFKRHSYFSYYRITRQRWVELRLEEVNRIKY